jgi:hypothetical protein
MKRVRKREEACAEFWWKILRERDTLGRPRRRWEDNIKANLQELGCGVWTGLSWLRIGKGGGDLVNAVMDLPSNVEKFLTSCKPVSF